MSYFCPPPVKVGKKLDFSVAVLSNPEIFNEYSLICSALLITIRLPSNNPKFTDLPLSINSQLYPLKREVTDLFILQLLYHLQLELSTLLQTELSWKYCVTFIGIIIIMIINILIKVMLLFNVSFALILSTLYDCFSD